MRKLIYLFFFIISVNCSNDDSLNNNSSNVVTPPIDQTINPDGTYFHMKVNGANILILDTPPYPSGFNGVSISRMGDIFEIGGSYGITYTTMGTHRLNIIFRKDGQLVTANQSSQNFDLFSGELQYDNFLHYPDNYFTITISSIDEINKRIKGSFFGKLYLDKLNLDSESTSFEATFDWKYGEGGTTPFITVNGVPQYCSAKLNGNSWSALRENSYGTFTAGDPYKFDIHFDSNATVGSYNFTNSSTDNYVRFSKFNTTTRTFDYYNASGVITNSYREFHGANRYSYIGTYTFTAVNPNNPSDIIEVSDGSFRTYQQN